MVKGLLQQEISATGVHCGQSGATVDILPTHTRRQEARPTLDWPFSRISLCRDSTYCLELPSQYKFHNVFHVSLLKGYDDSGADRAEVNPALIVLEPSGDQEFEVECIIGHWHVGRNRAL